jgi:hypothetical protein
MRKLVALVVTMAFALGVGLTVPTTFAQTPTPKEEKKGEMMDKKDEKKGKSDKKKGEKKSKKADKKTMDKKEEKK